MTNTRLLIISVLTLLVPCSAFAQQNVPAAVQSTEKSAERAAKRFGMGLQGGIGLDPEIIDLGVHATFGPLFKPTLQFRPGLEFGLGEVTTLFAVNLDFLYSIPEGSRDSGWIPYVGAGPNFSLSHRGFTTEETDHVDTGSGTTTDTTGRFDFSDTDFDGGMNFIVGMRKRSGVFFEMKATAWGVANVRLLGGFNF